MNNGDAISATTSTRPGGYVPGTCIMANDEVDVPETCPVHPGNPWPCRTGVDAYEAELRDRLTLDPPKPAETYRCPIDERNPTGCGETFTATPDAEGIVDCPACGLWFMPAREPATIITSPAAATEKDR